MGCVEHAMSERGPKFQVAVRASAGGAFTFEIFSVSGEPRTLQVNSQHYPTPGDAARAGYAALAAKGLQRWKTGSVESGWEHSQSTVGKSGEVGILAPLVLGTNVIAAVVAWHAVGSLLG
jgi:hypothetical protein